MYPMSIHIQGCTVHLRSTDQTLPKASFPSDSSGNDASGHHTQCKLCGQHCLQLFTMYVSGTQEHGLSLQQLAVLYYDHRAALQAQGAATYQETNEQ